MVENHQGIFHRKCKQHAYVYIYVCAYMCVYVCVVCVCVCVNNLQRSDLSRVGLSKEARNRECTAHRQRIAERWQMNMIDSRR